MKKNKKARTIFIVLVLGFILRILLFNFGTLDLDYHTFLAWSNILVHNGFNNFYNGWSDYLPGYLYILYFLGKIKTIVPLPELFIYKLPAILADLATGFLIYKIVKKLKSEKLALISSILYIANPAIIANSTLWGQVDSLTTLFTLASISLFPQNWLASSLILSVVASIKPQGALAAPIILFMMIKRKWSLKSISIYIIISLIFFILLFVPFNNTNNLIGFIINRLNVTTGQYSYTSINAFNFWGLFGFWQQDSLVKAGIGYSLIFFFYIIFAVKLWDKKGSEYILTSIIFTTSFLFFTRMHERHLLPALAPLLITASIYPATFITYCLLSLGYIANLYYSFVWITQSFKSIFSDLIIKAFTIVNLSSLIFIIKPIFFQNKTEFKKDLPDPLPSLKLNKNQSKKFLFLILLFAFLTRTISLSNPTHEYFDEVYHAFTARRLIHGDIKVWEWWNPSPEGFAYEWTHPPVAKLVMWTGMKILGENSFGWRFPAAVVGTLTVYLVYKLTFEIFKDEALGLLAAATFALEGLPLVLSRIGMNDIYFLFFTLLSLFLFIKDKNFLSSVSLGLAAASKWSTLWAIPILFVAFFVLKKKLKVSHIFFFIIPLIVYLATYIPMFTSGHTLDTFIGMQKQMWWYHTNLKATHPYTSLWYTWPFLIRPIWLYTSGEIGGYISNIYAQGNPVVFWFGVISIATTIFYTIKTKSKKLGFIVFSYLVFFVPWAASPRIMFLYHYLPSIPFMCMAIAYVLRKNPKYIPIFFTFALIVFIYLYPHFTGIKVPVWLDNSYYWFDSWK
ncbi:MAG: glycosyltransferase family 39 protein [Candidatus Woesebacteria bacterium]|nr:MAG: glycosyltransferase family 39 protein [Candidatus Woesebacteria bacterium]